MPKVSVQIVSVVENDTSHVVHEQYLIDPSTGEMDEASYQAIILDTENLAPTHAEVEARLYEASVMERLGDADQDALDEISYLPAVSNPPQEHD